VLPWLPATRGQEPPPATPEVTASPATPDAEGGLTPGSGPADEVVPAGCSTCNSGLIGGKLPPPQVGGGDFPGISGCTGCGNCYPGRSCCCRCDDKDTIVGRIACSLYNCICCPDPCYEGRWTPLSDCAFYQDAFRPVTQTRLRWDGYGDIIDPDRSEFFWPRADGKGKGPKPPKGFLAERTVRDDDLKLVTEGGNGTISLVVETPFRNLQGDVDGHASGFGDLTIATKTLLLDCELLQFSFQMKVYTPTGNFLKGLGTGHVSLEPSCLLGLKLTPTTYFQCQVAEWIPIGGDTAYQGDVLHYHFSVNQELFSLASNVPIIGTLETNCWSFQHGNYTDPVLGPFQPSSGQTYVTLGCGLRLFVCDRLDFGIATAHAISSVRLARDIYTAEFRLRY
jgi:hypothetical protein